MRTNTNTRRLTLNAILLAMGLVLHQIRYNTYNVIYTYGYK